MIRQPITTRMTSREFNRDVAKAKRAAKEGPVIVTDRGEPAHVLISYQDFERLRRGRTLADVFDDRVSGHIDIPIPERSSLDGSRIPDFSRD